MRTKSYFSILLIAVFALSILMISPSVYAAGDYVNLTKVKLGGAYLDKLKPYYAKWDKYAKNARKMYPYEVALIRAQIAICEAAAADNDMPKFKKELKKLKKVTKKFKKMAKKQKLYFAPQGLEMK